MAITAADVKALREATGAGMMECKKALTECNGDMAEAEKYLKEKGLAAMAKRAERATTEGRLFIRQNGNKIAVVELTCETDFVANNADFIAVGEKLLDVTFEKGYTQQEELKNLIFLHSILFRMHVTCSMTKLLKRFLRFLSFLELMQKLQNFLRLLELKSSRTLLKLTITEQSM